MDHPTVSTPRPFTEAEQAMRQRAQQALVQQRLNAKKQAAGEQAFRRAVRSSDPLTLPVPASPVMQALSPAAAAVIPATLEAAMQSVRRPRPGTPAAYALKAVERASGIIEQGIKRREARHNARMVFRALVQAAYTLIEVRDQLREHVTTYTFFTVVELLPLVTGLSSDQCERATRRLQDLGLIYKSSGALPVGQGNTRKYQGGTWVPTTFVDPKTGKKETRKACAGTWVAVLLRPLPGSKARVVSHELPPCPRDLTLDRKEGRTAWQRVQESRTEVRESFSLSGDRMDIAPLIQWSLSGHDRKVPGTEDSRTSVFQEARTPQDLVWSLSRVASVHPRHRREAVQEAADRLVKVLDDKGSEKHYYRILWRATEAEFRGIPAYAQLAAALQRTLIAQNELDLRRPGAWLTQELRKCGWLDEVYRGGALQA